MNTKQLLANYHLLGAEERFRLILAASGRDDEAERDRLVKTGKPQSLAMGDHWPYAQAFSEIAN